MKLILIEFDDGERELPTTIQCTCTTSGKVIPMHWRPFCKMVKRRYRNSYKYFLDNYVCRGASSIPVETDESKPEGYRRFLVAMYKAAEGSGQKDDMTVYSERYVDRYNEPISAVI